LAPKFTYDEFLKIAGEMVKLGLIDKHENPENYAITDKGLRWYSMLDTLVQYKLLVELGNYLVDI
jgi:predicted transcriptional regulator